jgi:hypothetical protein
MLVVNEERFILLRLVEGLAVMSRRVGRRNDVGEMVIAVSRWGMDIVVIYEVGE